MPIYSDRRTGYKAPPEASVLWDNFRGGLNTLLASTELAQSELVQMDNLQLVGKGIPKKRSGSDNYFLTAASVATGDQKVRGLKMVKFASGASGVLELLALSDSGYLVRRNGASYTVLPGYSYASGFDATMAQIFNRVFVANGTNSLTKYNGVSIFPFTTISRPTNITATNVSGVSGTFTYSYMVSAENDVGETLASDRVLVLNNPFNLASTTIRLSIPAASPASSVVRYNVYARDQGFETFLTSIPAAGTATVQFFDNGSLFPSLIALPPEGDTSGGPIFKYLTVNKDKIVGANVAGAPSRVVWSGGGQYIDRFHWSVGGGYVEISPDDGDVITGIVDAFDGIIVFKERSIWKINLNVASSGIVIPTISLISRAIGCIAPKTIEQVENDVFFLNRKGVYVVGNEPNIIGEILRTNEISAKIRSVFANLNTTQMTQCAAIYHDSKYRVAYPTAGSAYNNEEVWYDRERLSWVGPMNYPAAPNTYEVFVDGENKEHLLWGDSNDNFVTEFGPGFRSDKGVVISTILLTKKEIFKDPFLFKRVHKIFTNWRNTSGSINVSILVEGRDGQTTVAKSFTITPASTGVGWGFDPWGAAGPWGATRGAGSGSASADLVRWLKLVQTARNIQFEITTTGQNDNYELLSIKITYKVLSELFIPGSTRVA